MSGDTLIIPLPKPNQKLRTAIERRNYFNRSDLKARRWTDSLISKLLGEPDETAMNPYYTTAAPVKLYLVDRVIPIEGAQEFQESLDRRKRRRQPKRSSHEVRCEAQEVRREATLEAAWDLEWDVPVMEKAELIRAACHSYNDYQLMERNTFEFRRAQPDSNPGFLDRICVNYLRHELTDYDDNLAMFRGRIGVAEAERIIRIEALDAIARQYPNLARECDRQASTGW